MWQTHNARPETPTFVRQHHVLPTSFRFASPFFLKKKSVASRFRHFFFSEFFWCVFFSSSSFCGSTFSDGRTRAHVTNTSPFQFSTAQCEKHPKHGSGAMSIQGKSAGNKTTVDESLLCYGGPRNECVARLFVRAGTLPRYDHHLCSDSSCWKRLSRDCHTKLV